MRPEVEEFLKLNQIEFKLHKHKAVYTCEEAEEHCSMVEGVACKNLFLKDKRTNVFFLVVMPASKRADLKRIKVLTDAKHITFGKPEELMDVLGLEPGSVSPFGLLNDKKNVVRTYVDKDLWGASRVSFHPNQNDESIELEKEMFHKAVENVGNSYKVVEL